MDVRLKQDETMSLHVQRLPRSVVSAIGAMFSRRLAQAPLDRPSSRRDEHLRHLS
jgi:hypothetical protein